MKRLNKLIAILFFLIPVKIFCQDFSHSAELPVVGKPGFYTITIARDASAFLDPSLKDLRIVNSKGVAVPYIINTDLPKIKSESHPSLKIIENSLKDSGRSYLVLENTAKIPIEGLALIIRNASVSRTASISGSDDGKKWYTIAEHFELMGGRFSDSTRFVLNIEMPKSSYTYFKLVIDNLKNDPLNIVEAGSYSPGVYNKWVMQRSTTELLAFNNPTPTFTQRDSSDGYSYITVKQQQPYHIDNIGISIKNTRYYTRRMQVILGNTSYDFMLNGMNTFTLPRFASTEFLIKIFNGDNPPLQISDVTTKQEKKEVIAYLETEEVYKLLMGNKAAVAPSYDLEYFRDSISNAQVLNMGPIEANAKLTIKQVKGNNTSLWLIIIGVLVILSFFTWNLTKEVNKKRNQ